jgi:hypothetical protein
MQSAVTSWSRLSESFLPLLRPRFMMLDAWVFDPSISESIRPRSDEEEVINNSGPSSSSATDLTAPEDLSPDLFAVVVRRGELRVFELLSESSGRLSNWKQSRLVDGSASSPDPSCSKVWVSPPEYSSDNKLVDEGKTFIEADFTSACSIRMLQIDGPLIEDG